MILKPAWLLLVSTIGVSLGEYTANNVQGEIAEAIGAQGQQPLFYDPPAHYPDDKCPCTTIYELLSNDSRFSLLTKALKYVEDVASLLNDSSSRVTLFAPPDRVLRRPGEKSCPDDSCFADASFTSPFLNFDSASELDIPVTGYGNLGDAIMAMDELESVDHTEEPDDEKRRKIIKAVIRAILRYHIIPGVHDSESFGENMTYPTNLTVRGALDDQPLRLRISKSVIPRATKINLFTRITRSDIKALNGFVHVVDGPLIPPPSVFQQLYLVPGIFSTLTSALQRTGLNNFTDLRFVHGGNLTGASAVTIFAPTNDAFDALPKKLKLFLFSPFGEKALKKLLEYHIVPNAIVHSNFIHGDVIEPIEEFGGGVYAVEEECIGSWSKKHKHRKHKKHPKPHHTELLSTLNLTLVSLLPNHTIDTVIVRERVTFPEEAAMRRKHKHKKHPEYRLINTKVIANKQPTIMSDIVAFNGAIHVVNRLLDPRHCRCGGSLNFDSQASWASFGDDADADADSNDVEAFDGPHIDGGNLWDDWQTWFLEWVKADID